MNPDVVVDVSVGLKWVLAEEYAAHAQALLTQCLRESMRIAVPPHLLSEIGMPPISVFAAGTSRKKKLSMRTLPSSSCRKRCRRRRGNERTQWQQAPSMALVSAL